MQQFGALNAGLKPRDYMLIVAVYPGIGMVYSLSLILIRHHIGDVE
jgi:hypothetical protein